ncbi:MAG TPA: ferredoxin family protein [Thermoanaerobaculia bacterium]|nr:ferredoxin family protein [Thermoanaerobaculia bacterium]
MTYVINDSCLGERYATCVSVCPVDCIHPGNYEGEIFMVIDPKVCIDCGLCLPECPVGAILEGAEASEWAAINAQLAPEFEGNAPVSTRPRNDPPRKRGHVIVNP